MAAESAAHAEFIRRPSMSGLSRWVKGKGGKVEGGATAKFADPGPAWKVLGHRRKCRMELANEEEDAAHRVERISLGTEDSEQQAEEFARNYSCDSNKSNASTEVDEFRRANSAGSVHRVRSVDISMDAPDGELSAEEDDAIARWSRSMSLSMPSPDKGNLLTQSEGWHMLGLRKKVREGKTIKMHRHCVFKQPEAVKEQKSVLGNVKEKMSKVLK